MSELTVQVTAHSRDFCTLGDENLINELAARLVQMNEKGVHINLARVNPSTVKISDYRPHAWETMAGEHARHPYTITLPHTPKRPLSDSEFIQFCADRIETIYNRNPQITSMNIRHHPFFPKTYLLLMATNDN